MARAVWGKAQVAVVGRGHRKRHFVGSKRAKFNRRITGIWWLEIGGLKEVCSVQSPFCQTQGRVGLPS